MYLRNGCKNRYIWPINAAAERLKSNNIITHVVDESVAHFWAEKEFEQR